MGESISSLAERGKIEASKIGAILLEGRETEYGTPTPMAYILVDRNVHYRVIQGVAFRLAAEIEALSMSFQWVVNVGRVCHYDEKYSRVQVSLELSEGTSMEACQGMSILNSAIAAVLKAKVL